MKKVWRSEIAAEMTKGDEAVVVFMEERSRSFKRREGGHGISISSASGACVRRKQAFYLARKQERKSLCA